jgi:pimeloyl-ACP methyl ester carboxylesterase
MNHHPSSFRVGQAFPHSESDLADARAADVHERFAELDGRLIRYRDSGGQGPAVLLTHGIGESLEFWHRQMETLGDSLRLIAWDMPGHGLSDEVPEAMDLEGQARVAWRLLDRLGVKRVHLVGNSLGAAVSLRMAAQATEKVATLLLANGATLGPEVMGAFRAMSLPGLGELMNRPGASAVAQQIKAIVHHPASVTPEVRAAIERNVHRPGGTQHFLALLRNLTTWRGQRPEPCLRTRHILKSLRVPVLFVHGDNDTVLPVAQSRRAHAQTRGSYLVTLSACGHTPQLEQVEVFNSMLLDLCTQGHVLKHTA